jgi:hypothetical protein
MSECNPQRDRIQAIQKSTAFQGLKSAIDSGALNFRYILASHGTGSTSVALKLGQEGDFDIVVNEPDCAHFVNNSLGHTHEVEDVYGYLFDAYNNTKAQHLGEGAPISMLVKFMPSSWPYYYEYDSLLELNDQPLFLTRYPAFSVESRLRQICRLLSDEYDQDFGYSSAVKQQFNQCVSDRNFANCPAHVLNTHRSFYKKTPQMQAVADQVNALWANEAGGLGEANLPESMLFNYFSHFTANYTIRSRWEALKARPFNDVLDFEVFQYDPDYLSQHIVKSLWGLSPSKASAHNLSFKNAYDDFYPEGENKIFSDITFGRSLKLDGQILPPTVQPLHLNQFPVSLQPPLRGLIDLYIDQMKTSNIHFPLITPQDERRMQKQGTVLNPVFVFNAYSIGSVQGIPAYQKTRGDVWPAQYREHFTPCYRAVSKPQKCIPHDMFPQ